MLKRILLALMLCVGIGVVDATHEAKAGSAATGAHRNGGIVPRPVYGICGYIVIEPNGLYQEGMGHIYHTHADGSTWSPEVIARYYSDNTVRLGLVTYRWLPEGKTWTNMLTGETGTGSYWMSPELVICKNSSAIETSMQPYVKDLFIGVESKKVIYFQCTSAFLVDQGKWEIVVSIKNNNTGAMDVKWAYQWSGTYSDNTTGFNGHYLWGGCFELHNTSPYASTQGKSGGNYLMGYYIGNGQWIPLDSTFTLRTYHAASGFTVYNSNPVPGFWLAKVP